MLKCNNSFLDKVLTLLQEKIIYDEELSEVETSVKDYIKILRKNYVQFIQTISKVELDIVDTRGQFIFLMVI